MVGFPSEVGGMSLLDDVDRGSLQRIHGAFDVKDAMEERVLHVQILKIASWQDPSDLAGKALPLAPDPRNRRP